MKQLIYIFFSFFIFISCTKKQELNSITTLELKELLSKEKIQLVDVRTQKEIDLGSIETSLYINYFDSDFMIKVVSKLDKTKPGLFIL